MRVYRLTVCRNIPLNLDKATISPHRGPTYDQEYLRELKANTPTSRSVVANDPYDADMSMDVEDVSMLSIDSANVFGQSLPLTQCLVLTYLQKILRL
jgi:GC-rich sequence DNA-binding factor